MTSYSLRITRYSLRVNIVQRLLRRFAADGQRRAGLFSQRLAHQNFEHALPLFAVPRAHALGRAVVAARLIDRANFR